MNRLSKSFLLVLCSFLAIQNLWSSPYGCFLWTDAYATHYTITSTGILIAKVKKDTDPKKPTRPVPKIAKPQYDKVPPLPVRAPAKPPKPESGNNKASIKISAPTNGRKMNDPKAQQRNNLINQMEREKQQLQQQQATERADFNKNANQLLSSPRGVQASKAQEIQKNQAEIQKFNNIAAAKPAMSPLVKNTVKPIAKENKQLNKDIKVAQGKEQKILKGLPKAESQLNKKQATQTAHQQKTQKATIKSVANKQQSQMKKEGTKIKTSKPRRRKH